MSVTARRLLVPLKDRMRPRPKKTELTMPELTLYGLSLASFVYGRSHDGLLQVVLRVMTSKANCDAAVHYFDR
jgi:hypothetical protein